MKFFQRPKFLIPVLLLLVLVIVGSIAGYALGRFRTAVVLTDAVNSRTQLVDNFRLLATRSGGNTNDEDSDTDTAYLLPGTDLEIQLSIEGKTQVRSCLYVEISGKMDPNMIADGWNLLSGVTGKHGGAIYAYSTVLDGTNTDLSVPILRKGLTMDANAEAALSDLSFCGYLLQVTTEADRGVDQARTTFINKFPQG